MLLSKTHIPQIDDSWSWSRLILSQLLTWFRVTHVRTSWINSHNMMIKSASKLKYQQHSSLTLPCKVCYWNEVHSPWWEVTQHFCLCAYPHLSHDLREPDGPDPWFSDETRKDISRLTPCTRGEAGVMYREAAAREGWWAELWAAAVMAAAVLLSGCDGPGEVKPATQSRVKFEL